MPVPSSTHLGTRSSLPSKGHTLPFLTSDVTWKTQNRRSLLPKPSQDHCFVSLKGGDNGRASLVLALLLPPKRNGPEWLSSALGDSSKRWRVRSPVLTRPAMGILPETPTGVAGCRGPPDLAKERGSGCSLWRTSSPDWRTLGLLGLQGFQKDRDTLLRKAY